ncbi:MAG: hypothetical protein VYB54_04120 [Pseudomonadota bacterium]|nr:hypothetical protein [Pseudomonadota bacterium]
MQPEDLLARFAKTLRSDIGPAVKAEYPRTQAFLGAVVLEKLATELRLSQAHARAAAADRAALRRDLGAMLGAAKAPASVSEAFAAMADGGDASLCRFIEALYASRDTLGAERFDAMLGRVRQDLRRAIDRRMEVAR